MDKYAKLKKEILDSGGKISTNASAFRLLYALCKVKGITSMHHSRNYIASCNKIKRGRVDSLAKEAVNRYLETGVFSPPIEFLYLPDTPKPRGK